ncbi:MAG: CPXCG motif-containing cysteine-rich protein [Thermoguttaceae bacterium]|jgi:transcription elongation factor Elf1
MGKKRRKQRRRPSEDAKYVCDACGEEIMVSVDLSAGESQEYVEDCPICCRPNIIHVEIVEGGDIRVWAEAE